MSAMEGYDGELWLPQGPISLQGVKEQYVVFKKKFAKTIYPDFGTEKCPEHITRAMDESIVETYGNDFAESSRRFQQKNFEFLEKIHRGRRSTIYVARHELGVVVLKRFTTRCLPALSLPWKEFDYLRTLKHPRVLPILGAFQDTSPFLVLERCAGSLAKIVVNMTQGEKIRAGIQVMEAVRFMHSRSIVFNNLTLNSVMLNTKMNVVISDFSNAIWLKESNQFQSSVLFGNMDCLNLEALEHMTYSFQTDLHASALLLFELDKGQKLLPASNLTRNDYIGILKNGVQCYIDGLGEITVPLRNKFSASSLGNSLFQLFEPANEYGADDFLKDPHVIAIMQKHGFSLENLDRDEEVILATEQQNITVRKNESMDLWDPYYFNFYFDDQDNSSNANLEECIEEIEQKTSEIFISSLEAHVEVKTLFEENLVDSLVNSLEDGTDNFASQYFDGLLSRLFGTQDNNFVHGLNINSDETSNRPSSENPTEEQVMVSRASRALTPPPMSSGSQCTVITHNARASLRNPVPSTSKGSSRTPKKNVQSLSWYDRSKKRRKFCFSPVQNRNDDGGRNDSRSTVTDTAHSSVQAPQVTQLQHARKISGGSNIVMSTQQQKTQE